METKYKTIAAISTGTGTSGIGIVRLSGPEAITIADRIFKGKKPLSLQDSHTLQYGRIFDNSELIDEVLATVLRAPKSYTGEDTVEINCHGGRYCLRKTLQLLIDNGAAPAMPGEFTKRAFLNGKLDLSQAEAVADLIAAKSRMAGESAVLALRGIIKQKVRELRGKIIYNIAYIEAALDDPEHIDLDGYSSELEVALLQYIDELDMLIQSFDKGRFIREGIRTVILGKPNAGKSSLLNAFLGEERAIVTEIPGTTRDVLEEILQFEGYDLRLIDTAGLRKTEDPIEKIGVDRAKNQAFNADLLLYIIDRSDEKTNDLLLEMQENMHGLEKKIYLFLLNKTDLNTGIKSSDLDEIIKQVFRSAGVASPTFKIIEISALTGEGIADVEEAISDLFFKEKINYNDEVIISNIRHKNALYSAKTSLNKVLESIAAGLPEDFYSIDLTDASNYLGEITGETTGEEIINEIFAKFCLGK
ncbi:MAG: tRNA uridine-5-carboxymethylaminomethyl(34) synthesis GTPase MnmE [Lachnospiraceae bacterium]|jgi:tRNA modification GTPase|nr:tRNA uridine-5-carboxymethylaminomethyl(34) synthesis GTPase MnmE [Lachnospiraceae bacterium]